MSWLRIDDGFTEHPKVIALGGPVSRWAWLEILTYCARRQTGGIIPPEIGDVLRRATPALLRRAETVGLIDIGEQGERIIHDWRVYNGQTLEEKVAALLLRSPDATANEICKTVGGKREVVLRIIAQLRPSAGSPPIPGNQETGSPTDSLPVPNRFTRARSPAPRTTTKAVTSTTDAHAEPDETNGPRPDHEDPDEQERLATLIANTTDSLRSL